MKIHILEPDGFPEKAIALLRQDHDVFCGRIRDSERHEINAIFVRLSQKIDSDFHRHYNKLEYIVSPTTGLDHIDCAYFEARGVTLISLRGRTEFLSNIHATAELTVSLCLALMRDLPNAAFSTLAGNWNRAPHKGRELHGKTVGILGYGRIGRLVEPLFQAFCCKVLVNDVRNSAVAGKNTFKVAEDLAAIGILTIHLPLNEDTRNFVDGRMLDHLSEASYVINTSRGDIVDQEALFDRLERGTLAGAALDVLSGEPQPIDAVLQARLNRLSDRLLVTPHIGGLTYESLEAVELYLTTEFLDAIAC